MGEKAVKFSPLLPIVNLGHRFSFFHDLCWSQARLFWLYQSLSFCRDRAGLVVRPKASRCWHPDSSPHRSLSWTRVPLSYEGRAGFQNYAPLPSLWEVWPGWSRCSLFWHSLCVRHCYHKAISAVPVDTSPRLSETNQCIKVMCILFCPFYRGMSWDCCGLLAPVQPRHL